MYKLISTKIFDKRLRNLKRILRLSDSDVKEAIEEIKYTLSELQQNGTLPPEFSPHELTDDPWKGWQEYHILDYLLVVNLKVEKNHIIWLTTITTHHELRKGPFK